MPPRCFLALTLPEAVVSTLCEARGTFLAREPEWAREKWVAAPLLHVTLAFLGPLDDDLEAGVRRMRTAAALVPRFDLRLPGVTAVPSPRRAAMLWAILDDPDGRLSGLRDDLVPAFPSPAVGPERPLRPHVTLVRARRPRHVEAGALAEASAFCGGAW